MKTIKIGCSFCGEKERLEVKALFVMCLKCGCCGPYASNKDEAVSLWNNRIPSESLHILEQGKRKSSAVNSFEGHSTTPFVIVVPCSASKTVEPDIEMCLSSFRPMSQSILQEEWIRRIKNQEAKIAARNMYSGRAMRLLASLAMAHGVPMYIMSTGLGITESSTLIPAYDLAISKGHNSSITGRIVGNFDPQAWWEYISTNSPYAVSLESVYKAIPKGLVILCLTEDYSSMLRNELSALNKDDICRTRIIASPGIILPSGIETCLMPYNPSLSRDVISSGPLIDFPYRAAAHYIQNRLLQSTQTEALPNECHAWVKDAHNDVIKLRAPTSLDSGTSGVTIGADDIRVSEAIISFNLTRLGANKGVTELRSKGISCSLERYTRILRHLQTEIIR